MSIEFNDLNGLAGTADIMKMLIIIHSMCGILKPIKNLITIVNMINGYIFPVNHLTHCQYNEYALQLSIYGVMYERETNKKLNRCGIFYWDRILKLLV